jgi:competence protein ComEA
MKKSGIDPERAGVEIASKDKQTLVLFLLGFFIIFLPFLSLERQLVATPLYGITQLTDTNRWQVVCFAEATIKKNFRAEKDDHLYQQMNPSARFFDKMSNRDLPAEFALFFNRPLPINKSRQEDLEMLPGIGPHLASLIIGELHRKGRFSGPEDLLEIPGIGPKSLQRILPLVSFEE